MRRRTLLFLTVLVAVTASLAAQDQTAVLQPLQGRWVVTSAEHNAKPLDAIKGGVMTITGSGFEIRTASGNVLKGTLRLDASKAPMQMDLLHADGARWEAIYAAEGETLRLNYVEAGGKDPRPAAFTTSAKTEETVISLRREGR